MRVLDGGCRWALGVHFFCAVKGVREWLLAMMRPGEEQVRGRGLQCRGTVKTSMVMVMFCVMSVNMTCK